MHAPQPTQNTISFADMLVAAEDLGKQRGQGLDTQIKFGLKIFEGAYHGAIDLDPNKHGTEVDDATKLAETYVKAQGTASFFDAKAPNQRKLISCCRTLTKLGGYSKGGNGEPLQTVNNLMAMRSKMRQNPAESKKLDDAFNTLMRFARTQIRRDTIMDDAELKDLCLRPQANLKTVEQILEATRKQLTNLKDGKAANNTAHDASKHVRSAIQSLTDRLKEIATDRGAGKKKAAA